MALEEHHLNVSCEATNLQEINKEIGQLKMVIGFILAKLPSEERQQVIDDLNRWGLPNSAEEFDQFANPRPPR
ncbi:hypothetical protein CDU00_07110 [Cronobacter sakazakii]|uniref:hypothetical protein n=1 Tax=Enterobacteriaceae TaxID=543 RepID=UPI000A198541|nr:MULTISPECIES: hypothetical protein [Enterobacteriaceae]EGZ6868159.1 hypothetical protein [Cronobacter sakazakii]EJQ0793552.1 hypothetical protein [Cronobacter sakazakii]EJQ2916755.1 hypothetical protein [Cronobacter sakazakii]EJR0496530.1 hypothetical protein [Cronobacter sakazakii]EKM1389511.1 hypothetical protein [Cronobacter sakazakii]